MQAHVLGAGQLEGHLAATEHVLPDVRVEAGAPARILYMTVPAGFDRFILEYELPTPNSKSEADAARYKIEILGPLPE